MDRLVAVLAVVLLVLLLVIKCESDKLAVVKDQLQVVNQLGEIQQADNDRQTKEYQIQLLEAKSNAKSIQAELVAERSKPKPKLVCHAAVSASTVPSVPQPTLDQSATARVNEVGGGQSFDPSPALYAAADAADDVIEACRLAMDQWPRGRASLDVR